MAKKGVIFTVPEAARAKDVIERVEADPRYRRRPVPTRNRSSPGIAKKVGILLGDLDPASNAIDSPATATLRVYNYDDDGDLVDSTKDITVTNRYTEIGTISSGSLLMVIQHGPEWWPIAADCSATATS